MRYRYNTMARENIAKYGKAPTWEMIQNLIDKTKMKMYHLERFLDIPFNTLTLLKNQPETGRKLEPKHWHYFYEQSIPEYGVKYVLVEKSMVKDREEPKKKVVEKKGVRKVAKVIKIEKDIHERLSKIK